MIVKASKRSQGVSYAIRDVVLPARELEKQGIEVLHLNIGDPIKYDFDCPDHMKDALYEGAKEDIMGILHQKGMLNYGMLLLNVKRNGMRLIML